MGRRLPLVLWGLAGLCSMTGCSFLFVHGPPPDHQRLPYFDCSSSNVLPVLDALYAGLAATDAALAGSGSRAFSTTSSSTTDAWVLAGEAALVGASAVYGFSKTSDCRKAQVAMLKRAATRPQGGPMFGPSGSSPTFAPPGAPPVDPWTGRPVGTSPPPYAPPPPPAPAPAPAP